jgi:hypothetical protein
MDFFIPLSLVREIEDIIFGASPSLLELEIWTFSTALIILLEGNQQKRWIKRNIARSPPEP